MTASRSLSCPLLDTLATYTSVAQFCGVLTYAVASAGRKAFASKRSASPVTSASQMSSAQLEDRQITVIDTPGATTLQPPDFSLLPNYLHRWKFARTFG